MIELNVSGMTCDRCADHVREALEKLPGVQSVEVSYPQRTASVAVDPGTPASALTFAVTRLGYQARLANSGPTSCLLYTSPSPRDKRQSRMPSSA